MKTKIITPIELGATVLDNVTGFKGKTVAFCKYLNGCEQFEVQPELDVEGKWVTSKWIDAPQLILIESIKDDEPFMGDNNADPPSYGPGSHPDPRNPRSNTSPGWNREDI